MSAPIRWGILATGGIATKFTTDLKLVPDAAVVAVASRTEASARRFAAEHGIARAHGSWAELAADPDVDVVYVATPHSAHREAAAMMLAAGKAVLCEKPLTLGAPAAADLFALAAEHGVFLAEAMWMRANPLVRRARELVAGGAIGAVRAVHAEFCISGPADEAHRLRNPDLGGGALLDLGVYPVTLAEMFLGTPSSIAATASLTGLGVDETTGVLLGYDSGAHAVLSCSIAGTGPVGATVVGEAGYLVLEAPFHHPPALTLTRRGVEPVREEYVMEGNGLRFEAIEVMRCLREGLTESPILSRAGTMSVMETMDRVRERIGVTYPVGI